MHVARAGEGMGEIVNGCLHVRWGVEKIWKHAHVGNGSLGGGCDGHILNSWMGMREMLSSDVTSFFETHYLLESKIVDGQTTRTMKVRQAFDGGPVRRHMVCEVRSKLIIYRPPLHVQGLLGDHEAMRYRFCKRDDQESHHQWRESLLQKPWQRLGSGKRVLGMGLRLSGIGSFRWTVMVFGTMGMGFRGQVSRC
jgi:hypothetical protein